MLVWKMASVSNGPAFYFLINDETMDITESVFRITNS